MPETSDISVTAAQLAAGLAALVHGPYADASTASAADLAAETARYLNYAAAKGGITDPATISALTASLATTAYRLPQLLNTISEWLRAETTAGRIADDHRRFPRPANRPHPRRHHPSRRVRRRPCSRPRRSP